MRRCGGIEARASDQERRACWMSSSCLSTTPALLSSLRRPPSPHKSFDPLTPDLTRRKYPSSSSWRTHHRARHRRPCCRYRSSRLLLRHHLRHRQHPHHLQTLNPDPSLHQHSCRQRLQQPRPRPQQPRYFCLPPTPPPPSARARARRPTQPPHRAASRPTLPPHGVARSAPWPAGVRPPQLLPPQSTASSAREG